MTDTTGYLNDDDVTEVRITDAPRNNSVTGYGRKIPTQYMLRINKRWHRVYVMQYGNSGSSYVLKGGQELFLSSDTEHRLGMYAAAVHRSPENPAPQPTRIDKLSRGDRLRFQPDGVVNTLVSTAQTTGRYTWADYQGVHTLHAPSLGGDPFWPMVYPTQAEQTEVTFPEEGVGATTPLSTIQKEALV